MLLRDIIRQGLVWLRLIRQPDFSVQTVLMHPTIEEIESGQMLIVGGTKYQKWACFRCPGRCGETILLSLTPTRHPCWTASADWLGRPTIQPSVRQLNECGCHFWICQGNVNWCSDSAHNSVNY